MLTVTSLTMVLIPVLAHLARRLSGRIAAKRPVPPELTAVPAGSGKGRAIVVGHGRVGQIVCAMLERHGYPYISTDRDPAAVSEWRRRGREVYYGDAASPAFLKSCGLLEAAGVIVTIHDQDAIDEIVGVARALRPDILIVSRARDATHARHLYAIGVTDAVPETIEASLQLSEAALVGLGVPTGPGDRLHPRAARRVPPRAAGSSRTSRADGDARHPPQDAARVLESAIGDRPARGPQRSTIRSPARSR